jgi:capsular exopolysaccharide synthesis family protein
LREYERLAARISHARAEASFKTMMVTSPAHGEGTSTVCVNLALTLADRGLNVLLVDANLRRPGLHAVFHLSQTEGLTDLIAEEAALAESVRDTDHAQLRLVTAGRPAASPPALFETDRFARLLDELRNKFDLTIVDAPPVLEYADALALASKVERVIVVVQSEETQLDHLERAKDELEKNGGAVLGIVLNRKRSYGPLRLQQYVNL